MLSILKAKQKFTEKIDETSVEDKQWLRQVADSSKMFEIVQQLWLTLQHFGEACLRTGVEIVCDRRTRKVALMRGLTEDCEAELKQTVQDKVEIVINAAKLKETGMGQVRRLEEQLRSCKADFKAKEEKLEDELKQVKQMLSRCQEDLSSLRIQAEEKEEIGVPRDASQRSALKDLQNKYAELKEMYGNLQKTKDAKEAELSFMMQQLKEEGIEICKSKNDLQDQVASLQAKLKQLAEENQLLKAACQSDSAEVDMNKQRDKLQELEDRVAELKKSLQEVKQALSESEKQRDHAEARARVANDECENLRGKLAATGSSNALAIDDSRVKVVSAENDSLRVETSNLREANKDLRDKLEQVEAALTAALTAAQEALANAQQVPLDTSKLEPTTNWEEECEELKKELKKIRKERDKLIQANMDLEHEVHTLKTALEEMEMKVRELSDLASKSGAAAEMKSYLERSGLTSVLESWKCKEVFKRLYMDFWNRCKRMDELRAKMAPEHWESTQPSRPSVLQRRMTMPCSSAPLTQSQSNLSDALVPNVLSRRTSAPQLMRASAERPSHFMTELQRPQSTNFNAREVHLGFSTPEKVSSTIKLHSTEMAWPRSPQPYGGLTKRASMTDLWTNVDQDKNSVPSDFQDSRSPLWVQSAVKQVKNGEGKGLTSELTTPPFPAPGDPKEHHGDAKQRPHLSMSEPSSPVTSWSPKLAGVQSWPESEPSSPVTPGWSPKPGVCRTRMAGPRSSVRGSNVGTAAAEASMGRSLSLPSLQIQGLRRG